MIRCRKCGDDVDRCDCNIDYIAWEYDKNQKKMKPNWKYILSVLAVIAAGILLYLYVVATKKLNAERASFNERSQIVTETNKKVVDSIKKENTILAVSVIKYRAQYDSLQKAQAKIITNAKAFRNEINNTPDSGQLALLYLLLSEHRATPVKRD